MLSLVTRVLLQHQQRLNNHFFIPAVLGALCLLLILLVLTESDLRRTASKMGLDGEIGSRGYLVERLKMNLEETIDDLMRVMMFRMAGVLPCSIYLVGIRIVYSIFSLLLFLIIHDRNKDMISAYFFVLLECWRSPHREKLFLFCEDSIESKYKSSLLLFCVCLEPKGIFYFLKTTRNDEFHPSKRWKYVGG